MGLGSKLRFLNVINYFWLNIICQIHGEKTFVLFQHAQVLVCNKVQTMLKGPFLGGELWYERARFWSS